MAAKVTIKTIAADLGVSHMTVSRVLSGRPNVREELRKKILDRANELGYVKNTAALTMRGEKPPIVGLLIPNIRNEFYAHFADALTTACNEQGINLLIHLTHDDIEKEERALTLLQEAQAHSVLMVPAPAPADYQPARNIDLNLIEFIRTRPQSNPATSLIIDEEPAIDAAVARLIEIGHSNFAYIGADQKLGSGKRRHAFFVNSIKKQGLKSSQYSTHTGEPGFDFGYKSAKSILETADKNTAILCGGFNISLGALNALLQSNGHEFQNHAFIGYGDSTFYEWLGGGISTISLPMEALAQNAIDILLQYQSGSTPLKPQFTHIASLIVR